jgi:hypothetical protein
VSHPGSVAAPAAALGGPDDAFSRASIGIVPILWNNADLPNLVPADHVLDEIARLGFEGTQTGTGYPSGPAVVAALRARDLRLAEVYAALPFFMTSSTIGGFEVPPVAPRSTA